MSTEEKNSPKAGQEPETETSGEKKKREKSPYSPKRHNSAQRKGRYYLIKSRDWMRDKGYEVEIVEKTQRIVTREPNGKQHVLFAKRDLWGADLVARNKEEIIWIQVKSNRGDIAKGIKQLSVDDLWPEDSCVKRWVVYWEPRTREPEIVEVVEEEIDPEDSDSSV